jgi:predicted RNA-binding protein
MCESSAYILKDGNEELVLENVDFLQNDNDQVRMINLFGEEKTIRARVKMLSLVDHKIILQPI